MCGFLYVSADPMKFRKGLTFPSAEVTGSCEPLAWVRGTQPRSSGSTLCILTH